MMRVGLDIRMISSSGIGTTIQGLLNHLSNEERRQLILFGFSPFKNPDSIPFVHVPYPIYGIRQHWGYARLLSKYRLHLFHMPHFDVPLMYRGPFIATVHDLIHILFPHFSTKPFSALYAKALLAYVTKNARRIHVVSENTKRDLLRFFPKAESKTVVISPAIDDIFRPLDEEARDRVLAEYQLKPGYLLYVGNLRASKNTPFLLQAFEKFQRKTKFNHPLVLVGQNTYRNLTTAVLPVQTRYLGPVPRAHLPALYNGASLFVFPSLYEGFGLPPLEAMACGTPTVTSREGSLPETCGDGAEYTDARSIDDFVAVLGRLISSPDRREALRKKGFENAKRFSWKKYAESLWRLYQEAIEC